MNLSRGEIYWVAFPVRDGREQQGQRPVLIVHGAIFLQSLPTIWVVPITSNLRAVRFPGTIRIDPDDHNGLLMSSVVLVFQLQAIDKRRLLRSAGKITPAQLDQILDMINLLLGRRF
jgi:mRNA interferase MazF